MPRIKVTAELIRRGKPRSSSEDPIALAARAVGLTGAAVTPAGLKVGSLQYELPDDICNFVADWDAGRRVEPIAFDVPPLDGPGWRAIGARREGR